MRVFLAMISRNGTCTTEFANSMMRLQVALRSAPGVHVTIDAAPNVHTAARAAADDGNFDALVAISSDLAFGSAFVLRGLVAPFPFVTAVHPLPTIDWDRVAERKHDDNEDVRFRGNVYNIDPAAAKVAKGGTGYVEVPRAGFGGYIMKKEAFEAVANGGAVVDEAVTDLWGRPVHADLDNQCAVMGAMEFAGCVGARAVLR